MRYIIRPVETQSPVTYFSFKGSVTKTALFIINCKERLDEGLGLTKTGSRNHWVKGIDESTDTHTALQLQFCFLVLLFLLLSHVIITFKLIHYIF